MWRPFRRKKKAPSLDLGGNDDTLTWLVFGVIDVIASLADN